MCSIAGAVRWQGITGADVHSVKNMMSALQHRGPDGQGLAVLDKCALVQTRLALVDLRDIELPLRDASARYWIVYNGEIYNYKQLRSNLEADFEFSTQTDTEVVLAAYRQWGERCVDHLEGMFSFFIWDNERRVGFGARDPLGVKPFFYSNTNDAFFFASGAAALIKSRAIPFRVNDEFVIEYLTAPYFSGAQRTPFSGINILPPGTTLRLTSNGIEIGSYYKYSFRQNRDLDSSLGERLEQAVHEQLQADTEVGLFLSGGLDSTLLAALAKRPLKAWTINYRQNQVQDFSQSLIVKSDDVPMARLAAKEFSLQHREIQVDETQFDSFLEKTLATNDMVCAWEQEISQNILSFYAAQEVKAVLVGDAADETHFGYSFLMSEAVASSPKSIVNYFGAVPLKKSLSLDPVLELDHIYRTYAEKQGHSWKTREDQVYATSQLILDYWLPRLLHNGDTHTMAYSLEARVPFSHKSVLEWAQTLKFHSGLEKSHLRAVARSRMSSVLADRPKSALTKNLKGKKAIHRLFSKAWQEYEELLHAYVDIDQITSWSTRNAHELTDRDCGLEFRILALISWWRRFL